MQELYPLAYENRTKSRWAFYFRQSILLVLSGQLVAMGRDKPLHIGDSHLD